MVSASPNDQKYPRYPLVLKLNVTLARPLRLVILYFFKWKILSDDRRLYLHYGKWNSRSNVDGLTHTKQLLNLLCIVYIHNTHWSIPRYSPGPRESKTLVDSWFITEQLRCITVEPHVCCLLTERTLAISWTAWWSPTKLHRHNTEWW